MKNPFMSLWLSEWHKMSNAAQGQMMAEMTRQQNKMIKAWQTEVTEIWLATFMPWVATGKKTRRTR